MTLRRLILRNLLHYWRTNLAVMAGVATAAAVLAGALLVGQSVRDSLRSLLFQRIGAAEYVVTADRFFPEDLAGRIDLDPAAENPRQNCPIIYLQGAAIHQGTGSRALDVNVYGIDERFWKFHGQPGQKAPEDRTALVGVALARKLGVRAGDALLLRFESQQGIPRGSLYGRREEVGRTVRLVCAEILPAENLGEFALGSSQGSVFSIFVSLRRLQRDLGQLSSANTILLAPKTEGDRLGKIREALKRRSTLQDLGTKLRPLPAAGAFAVESSRIILDEPTAQATFAAAAEAGLKASGVFTYLANSIRAGGREIPYSVISAVDLEQSAMGSVATRERAVRTSAGAKGDIWLNDWAWRDLGSVPPGAAVEVDYYLWQEEGRLETRTAHFRLAGVVSIGGEVDAALAPDFPGISQTRSIAAWDPPFPLDFSRIRPKDEEYWDKYRTTPKAFVTLAQGQELWQSRFGRFSSIRIKLPANADPISMRENFEESLRKRLDPERGGFSLIALKERGLNASRGSTDFGEYFVYFSSFLIASAILLSTLFFRLGVEQRVREIGILLAAGFSRAVLYRIFLVEGALLSVGGSLLGLLGSIGYGWLLVFGLRTWWQGAVGTDRLYLHVSWADLGAGAVAGLLTSLGTIAWTLRGLRQNSPRALLSGELESIAVAGRRLRVLAVVSSVSLLAALVMLFGSALGKIPDTAGFFGAGLLLLISGLSWTALSLRRASPRPIIGHGWRAFLRLGARNAMHRPGRSLLCIALVASAIFIIVSVEAFRRDAQDISLERSSGTGGYPLLARSALPIVHDPNSTAGRDALGISDSELPVLARSTFVPFRLRPGDDASCLNLYAPQQPRILGAPHSFLAAGRFSFQKSLASTPEEIRNPWLLLESRAQDGVIPAIADANTIQYILHLAVGGELVLSRSDGSPLRLRLVAALRDSVFQGELLISDTNFLAAFPENEGFRFFLLDAPQPHPESLIQPLDERLAGYGFEVESSRDRLAAYHRVENTYLSTFQSLGALGLILGTAGLATVLLRNALERRKELALLRAVGYRRRVLSVIVVAENVALLAWGLACGTVCAVLAVLPALTARGGAFPKAMVGLILAGVLLAGSISSWMAALAALRSPLLGALRSE